MYIHIQCASKNQTILKRCQLLYTMEQKDDLYINTFDPRFLSGVKPAFLYVTAHHTYHYFSHQKLLILE